MTLETEFEQYELPLGTPFRISRETTAAAETVVVWFSTARCCSRRIRSLVCHLPMAGPFSTPWIGPVLVFMYDETPDWRVLSRLSGRDQGTRGIRECNERMLGRACSLS